MKQCSSCHEPKPLDQFSTRRASKDGLAYICNPCAIVKSRQWRAANAERHRNYSRRWQAENADRANARSREWRLENKDRRKQITKKWEASNPHQLRMKVAQRRSKIVIPSWADPVKIKAVYRDAIKRQAETGIAHHVDHIVPINHPIVCGLHVETNLQAIPALVNLQKSNRTWPDMPT